MNDENFYNYLMKLPLLEQIYELKKILDSYNKGRKTFVHELRLLL